MVVHIDYLHSRFTLAPPRLWLGHFWTDDSENSTTNRQRRTNTVSNTVDGSTVSVAAFYCAEWDRRANIFLVSVRRGPFLIL